MLGALDAEVQPIRDQLQNKKVLANGLIEGDLFGIRLGVATVGVGPSKSHQNTVTAIAHYGPDRVLNVGTCGGLVDETPRELLCCVSTIYREGPPNKCREMAKLQTLQVGRISSIVTVDRAVQTPTRRQSLAQHGAEICDMEASAIAAAVSAQQIPLYMLKVVSDTAGADPDDDVFSRAIPRHMAFVAFKKRATALMKTIVLPALEEVLAG